MKIGIVVVLCCLGVQVQAQMAVAPSTTIAANTTISPGVPSSSATIVQPTSGNPLAAACAQFTGATNTCAYPINVTSGNKGYVLIVSQGAGTVATPTKSAGTATIGTITPATSASTVGGAMRWFTFSITGTGSLTISETFSTSGNIGVFPFEVSNSSGVDSSSTCTVGTAVGGACFHSSNTFSTSYVTAAITPATAGDLLLIAEQNGTNQTISALTPYTISGQGPGTAGNDVSWFTANYTDSTTGNVAGTYTMTSGSQTESDSVLPIL